MRASMCAYGMAYRPRCEMAESAGPDGMAETVDGLHTPKPDVESKVEIATMALGAIRMTSSL